MLRTTWLWKGVGPLALGGLVLCGSTARGQEAQPPAPAPAAAIPAPPAPGADANATLGEAGRLENIKRQQLTDDIRQRLTRAREQVQAGNPEAALNLLRLARSVVNSDTSIDEDTRAALGREIEAQYMSTVRREEQIVAERHDRDRRAVVAEQQQRALGVLSQTQQTVDAMMVQFNALMTQGMYNVLYYGGTGDITAAVTPFYEATDIAKTARALVPNDPTPRAGRFVAMTTGFLAQELAFEQLKEYRFMLTMQDVARAMVPFPDNQVIEYPPADRWRELSEKRRAKYGKAVDLLARDKKTQSIIDKLDEPISMNFANETPLEDVLKYIKSATQGPNDSGIAIYVDPVGLQEAEQTLTSPIKIDLEGVPLKTTLRLMLAQLGLTYTVKDGLLTITSKDSEDQPTEIRVYPVADLAIIPLSLMGGGMGGGMGGMGGGMGGMGGGMGGMGMGGMGGGMGGMGGGMGGMGGMGMMSMPVQEPGDQPAGGFLQKKRN